jgi:HK97 family phage portal protein
MALLGLTTKAEHAKVTAEIEAKFMAETNVLAAELEALKAQLPFEKWQLLTAEAEKYIMPDPSVYANQADMYRVVSSVLQAVDAVSSAAALSDFEVARMIAGKEHKDIPNHPFELLLMRPNPLDSRYEFLYATVAYWLLNGNSYWWLNRSSNLDAPEELWCIPPSQIIPVPDNKMYLKGYKYYPGTGAELFLEPYEIVHFRSFNPRPSGFIGLSKMESIAKVAQGDLGMSDWNTRLFKDNNARLASVMTFEQMIADPTWEKIKADTREAARKREMLMLRGVGSGGVNWLQNSISQKDMEFLAGRQANKEEIYNTLAPGLFAWLSGNSTFSNANANRAAFNELAVYPIHVMMNQKITNEILPAYPGRPLVGYFEDIRINDKQLELAEQQQYALTHTVEEIRAEFYGDEPLGDERDQLLPAQITAQSAPAETPPVDNVIPDNTPQDTAPEDVAMENMGEDTPVEDTTVKKALDAWRRYAVRLVSKGRLQDALKFEHDNIPDSIRLQLADSLPACKTEADVYQLFSTIKTGKQKSEIVMLADKLDRILEAAIEGGGA